MDGGTIMQMIKKVSEYMKQHHMLSPGDTVVAGISGGADSVCLFRILTEMKKSIDFDLHVVHVNHLIRAEAGEDESFVEELCRQHRISFHAVHADVEAIAEKKHITTEEAGREVRYEAFERYLKEYAKNGNGKIAVAHNINDSAETVLFHLFRGSGVQGLTGILPVRDHIIRPLLCVERTEIEEYLHTIGQKYCTDKTNATDDYARNRIRHHILEYARKEICPEAVFHTQEAAEKLGDLYGLINRMTQKGYEQCVTIQNEKMVIDKEKLLTQDKVLRSYIIMHAFGQLIGTRKDLSAVHVNSVLELMDKQPGRSISLPYGYCATREYEGIRIQRVQGKKNMKTGKTSSQPIALEPENGVWKKAVLESGEVLEYGIFPRVLDELIPQKTYTKWFDYDKIKGRLFIRKREASDFIVINHKGQKQTIKAYFVNEKVPREKRDEIDLLACDNHILWILGSRISGYYKVSEDTKRILKVNLRGGARNG